MSGLDIAVDQGGWTKRERAFPDLYILPELTLTRE